MVTIKGVVNAGRVVKDDSIRGQEVLIKFEGGFHKEGSVFGTQRFNGEAVVDDPDASKQLVKHYGVNEKKIIKIVHPYSHVQVRCNPIGLNGKKFTMMFED